MIERITCLAIATALAAFSSAARADGSITASLAGLQVQLIDLAPDDGVAPSVTFSGLSGGSQLLLDANGDRLVAQGQHAFDPLAMSRAPSQGAGSSAFIAGDIFAGTFEMQASAFASSAQIGSADALAYAYFDDATLFPWLPFELSPHTRLVISGSATGTAFVTNGLTDVTQGEVILGLTTSLADASAGIATDYDLITFAAGDEQVDPISTSVQRQLSVSFDNAGADPRSGLFGTMLLAGATTFRTAASVPEPSTSVLTLVGLALLGLRRGRRGLFRAGTARSA